VQPFDDEMQDLKEENDEINLGMPKNECKV
jgi:hypothetical protein